MSSVRKTMLRAAGFNVEVTRKQQKHMYVRLKPCAGGADATGGSPAARFRVCVSAPLRYSDARIARFIEERASWIREHAAKMQVRERDREINGASASPTQEELAQWRAVVAAFVPLLIEKWAPIIGVSPGKLAYRNMVSRWGSCNVKTGRICINVQLAAQPPECLEYVVVHELCHLYEFNHSPGFWRMVESVLPDYEQWKRWLAQHGQNL